MLKMEIPRKAIYRLSLYYRSLQRLKQNNVATVSSATLAKAAGVKPTQLRKDLTYIGQFGTRGLGYAVDEMCDRLSTAIGRTSLQPVVLVGVGHLGSALARYDGFAKEGFEIVAAFDADIGKRQTITAGDASLKVRSTAGMKEFIRKRGIKMAILSVPVMVAQEVANELVDAGIQAILNFSPTVLQVPPLVFVNNVDLAIELENLSYFIR
ncbi:MAG TPA: redox-sensing transcriptional repressor Rex [Chthoniobacterales bacterium]|jgi:redox-sensing transcriptional repressor